jgi:acyl transferase domain-containing protein
MGKLRSFAFLVQRQCNSVTKPVANCRYARADGVNAIYIKRLDDAVRGSDVIRSIIRGTAVNSNGRTPGISLPSVDGLEAVIRKAYTRAGLDPAETAYVETPWYWD